MLVIRYNSQTWRAFYSMWFSCQETSCRKRGLYDPCFGVIIIITIVFFHCKWKNNTCDRNICFVKTYISCCVILQNDISESCIMFVIMILIIRLDVVWVNLGVQPIPDIQNHRNPSKIIKIMLKLVKTSKNRCFKSYSIILVIRFYTPVLVVNLMTFLMTFLK